ncbi:hypothetical protein PoB_006389600 [Plakobranchus ocellatus]|uniref:Uncharacterized protein n=1 Tax=Plakobranchus ocellatus TaxID=259542 RepID=A0AAV4CZL8_9GAST|nr:hypothetical protein PoB_006389600 [Plakobranchus ocellatus]
MAGLPAGLAWGHREVSDEHRTSEVARPGLKENDYSKAPYFLLHASYRSSRNAEEHVAYDDLRLTLVAATLLISCVGGRG